MRGGQGDSAAVGNGGKRCANKKQQRGEGSQHCTHPTSLNWPWLDQARPDWTGCPRPSPATQLGGPMHAQAGPRPGGRESHSRRSHNGSRRRAGRGEEEEEVEQEEDICFPPWWLCITCSGLFTAVALAAFGGTSPWLAPVPGRALSLPSHTCTPARMPSTLSARPPP